MNRFSHFIRKRRVARFNKKCKKNWDKRNKMIEVAVAQVNSFYHSSYTGHLLAFEPNWVAEIDQYTGELTRHIVRFPDFHTFDRVGYYLKAYRDTNEGVLTDEQMGELERLIQFF